MCTFSVLTDFSLTHYHSSQILVGSNKLYDNQPIWFLTDKDVTNNVYLCPFVDGLWNQSLPNQNLDAKIMANTKTLFPMFFKLLVVQAVEYYAIALMA